MSQRSPAMVRSFATGFAVILGLQASWILAAELIRPDIQFFPENEAQANITATKTLSAATAAWIGWPRGDLWADHAVTTNAALLGAALNLTSRRPSNANESGNGIAETAATLSPADARSWLLLATNAWAASKDGHALAQLKMSYYTSSYSNDLFPTRIQIAVRSSQGPDEELTSYLEYELGGILKSNEPELKQLIGATYRIASPSGRRFLENALAKLDPAFLADLRTARP